MITSLLLPHWRISSSTTSTIGQSALKGRNVVDDDVCDVVENIESTCGNVSVSAPPPATAFLCSLPLSWLMSAVSHVSRTTRPAVNESDALDIAVSAALSFVAAVNNGKSAFSGSVNVSQSKVSVPAWSSSPFITPAKYSLLNTQQQITAGITTGLGGLMAGAHGRARKAFK